MIYSQALRYQQISTKDIPVPYNFQNAKIDLKKSFHRLGYRIKTIKHEFETTPNNPRMILYNTKKSQI